MEVFMVLGLTLFLFTGMVITSVVMNIALGKNDDVFECPGFLFVILVLSIVLSLFFIRPEKFGYEKIVSNNFIKQEVEND